MVMQYETKIDRFIMERKFPVHFDLFQKEGLGSPLLKNIFFDFLKKIIYLFLERGEGKEKERERNINVWLPPPRSLLGTWPTTQACALTGNQTRESLVHRPALSPLCSPAQKSPHQGFFEVFKEKWYEWSAHT